MNPSVKPQPSRLLTISSILVIAGCVLFISAFLVSLYMTDLFFKLAGIIGALLPAALGIQQYRATFRQHPGAAKFTTLFLYVIAAFGCFGYVTNVGEAVLETSWHSLFYFGFVLLPLLIVGVSAFVAGKLNHHWSQLLKQYYAESATQPVRNLFTLRELFGAMTIMAVILGLSSVWSRVDQPPHALHVSRSEVPFHLPQNATDVSYCEGPRGLAYEFTTDEKSFTAWVEAEIITSDAKLSGVTLYPITYPVWIHKYYHFSPYLDGPHEGIDNGLQYLSNDYPPVQAIYDRDTGRAYYSEGFPPRYR